MLPQDIRFKERGVFVIIIETSCFLFENFVQNRLSIGRELKIAVEKKQA